MKLLMGLKKKQEEGDSAASSDNYTKDVTVKTKGKDNKKRNKLLFKGLKTKSKKKNKKILYKRKSGRFVSLDLGNYAIKFAVGNQSGDKIKVDKVFVSRLPENLYVDGAIADEKKLMDIIKAELTKRSVKDVDMVVSMESMAIIKRELTIPALEDTDTVELIGYELSEYLGVNADDYVVQHRVLKEYESDGTKQDILVNAMPKPMAKKVFNMLKQGGYNPCILGTQSSFVESMFKKYGFNGQTISENRTVAIADIGNRGMVINIYKDGVNQFNRIVKSTNSIRYALGLEMGLDDGVISTAINKFSNRNIFVDTPSSLEEENVFGVAIKCVKEWGAEIDRILEYYRSRSLGNTVDKLFIYGGETTMMELDLYIQENIGVPTEVIKRLQHVEFAKDIDRSAIPIYVNSISALIRS